MTGSTVAHEEDRDSEVVMRIIRTRHVVWRYLPIPLERDVLLALAEAAGRAPTANNDRPTRFILIDSPSMLKAVAATSPGITGSPAALLALCVDWAALKLKGPSGVENVRYDIGAAMQNALLAAESRQLGATPVTSFPKAAVAALLSMPVSWTVEALVTFGRREERTFVPRPDPLAGRLHWQRFSGEESDEMTMSDGGESRAILELAAYLASAAALLPDEPTEYAQFRLLEGALRALRSMTAAAPDDAELADATSNLERSIVSNLGNVERSREVAAALSEILARRLGRALDSNPGPATDHAV